MRSALIGYTGFIGGNLARQFDFDSLYNSKNIEDIAGRSYDVIICAGTPGAKWLANRDSDGDRAAIDRLFGALRMAEAGRVVYISTIDVYPSALGVDEDTPIEVTHDSQPYGKHRLMLEKAICERFDDCLIVRLPAMFGPGLKKNAIYDLLHNHETHKIHADGIFQFYNVNNLWGDLEVARSAELKLVNFATEPVGIRAIAEHAFGIEFTNDNGSPPARYDMRSVHAAIFGGHDGYLYDRKQILDQLRDYVQVEREASK